MKTNYRLINRVLALLAIAGILTGCATTRQEKSARTASTMGELRKLLATGAEQTGKLQDAAENLAKVKTDDLRQAYERFAMEAKQLRAVAAETRNVNTSMSKKAHDYFANWEKEVAEIGNGDLKEMSRERQFLVQQEYGEISSTMRELDMSYTAYETDLADIEKFLGNDLTRVGSDFAKPYLNKLSAKADLVKAATRKAEAAVAHLEDVLKPK